LSSLELKVPTNKQLVSGNWFLVTRFDVLGRTRSKVVAIVSLLDLECGVEGDFVDIKVQHAAAVMSRDTEFGRILYGHVI
jgi:hypothetical protein